MIEIVFAVMVIASFVYILVPLFGEPCWPFLKKGVLTDLRSAKKEGLTAISELDSEYEMGKLTNDDYVSLRESLKREVTPVIRKEMDIKALEESKPVELPADKFTSNLVREVIRICGIKH
jgi:hypothetical protein